MRESSSSTQALFQPMSGANNVQEWNSGCSPAMWQILSFPMIYSAPGQLRGVDKDLNLARYPSSSKNSINGSISYLASTFLLVFSLSCFTHRDHRTNSRYAGRSDGPPISRCFDVPSTLKHSPRVLTSLQIMAYQEPQESLSLNTNREV